MCRDSTDPEERKTYTNMKARFKLMMRLSKRKDAPRELKALVKIHKRKMENLKQRRKEFKLWKKSEDGLKHKELNKMYRKMQSRTWEWRSFSSRRCVERQIAQFPVVPIVLCKKKKKKYI